MQIYRDNPIHSFINATHEVHHYIATNGPPVAERPRRLLPQKYVATNKKFETMLEQGIY